MADYGLHVMKCVRFDNVEDYESGDYFVDESADPEEIYEKYTKKWGTILPYQWGVYCTAGAMRELFELGKCINYADGGQWLYSDTDSIYAYGWDEDAVRAYNDNIKRQLKARGYDPIYVNGKEFVLGSAADDGDYIEFKTVGAKRYVCRRPDDSIKLTVAGVPKKAGIECLQDDLNNFTPGLIFDGETTGKLTHTYIFNDSIYINEYGDEVGDSVNLSKCDYLLSLANIDDLDDLFIEELEGLSYYG